MRTIKVALLADAVRKLCVQANVNLRPDVLAALRAAYKDETAQRPRHILDAIIRNAHVAAKEHRAICQDTGIPVVLLEVGSECAVSGNIQAAINKGARAGYCAGCLRASIVSDPLLRGTPHAGAAIVHIESVPGKKVRVTLMPKGFGCENKSQLKMFTPTTPIEKIKDFIVDAVRVAGPDACPPYIVGVGIGGTADYACWLAKKALLRKVATSNVRANKVSGRPTSHGRFEIELLKAINKLNIGPMGLGGKTTALAVHVETYPTHIAGLPVAVNISCHALRSAAVTL
jgi:fumarate hydratase subunit alpha